MMKFMIVTTIAALGFFSAVGSAYAQTNENCYEPTNIGTVGQAGWAGCAGMYITDSTTLRAAADAGQTSGDYQISFEGADYTFGDSGNNIFTGQVTTMRALFAANSNFNKDIGYWDTSNVTDMGWMFNGASTFDKDISQWDTSSVVDMSHVFWQATDFNKPLGDWDVSSVTRMNGMFREASAFNQEIGSWDVSSVTTMEHMFFQATVFDRAIGSWDVSSVTTMKEMFKQSVFNKAIGDWNVRSVTIFDQMFNNNEVFDQPLGDWDVSGATNMNHMFFDATQFNQDLRSWNVPQFSAFNSFHTNSGMELAKLPIWGTGIVVENFDGTLAEGESSTFTVKLSSVPGADVAIDLTSSDASEGVLSPAQITFSAGTAANTAQTVTLTSQADGATDGDQSYTVTVAVSTSTSSDADYANKTPQTLSAVTADVDIPGLTFSTSTITVAEGATTTFTVQLDTAIDDKVVLDLSSSDPGEGVLSPARITFTTADNSAKTVTVTAPTDTVIDGNETYSITAAVNTASTLDDVYDAVSAATFNAVTTDTTNATLSFSDVIDAPEGATSSVTVSTGGVTSESEITIAYGAASGGTAGSEDYTSASSVTIPVGATSTKIEYFFIDDDLVETSETVVVQITSAETTVEGVTTTLNLPTSNQATLTAANINTAVVSVGATTQPSEDGPQSAVVTFTQSATSSHDTTVSYTLDGTADLNADYQDNSTPAGKVTIPAGSLTATAAFSILDDPNNEGDETIIVTLTSVDNDGTVSGDGDAIAVDPANNVATLTITDDDRPGLTFSTSSVEVTENDATGEFAVRLNSLPRSGVTFALTTSGAATTTESSLTFTTSNWSTLQTVTVSGADNNIADGTRSDTVTLTASSTDTNYNGTTTSVAVSVADDEVAGVTVATSPLDLNEGSTGTFTVVLDNQPVDVVTIGVSSDTAQATTSLSNLVFVPSNWDTPQTVTVGAVNNAVADGGRPATVVLATTTAGVSSAYNGVSVPDVDVNIADDDVAGVTVASTSVSVTEGGSAGTFTVVLTSQPTDTVTYAITVANGFATTTVSSITFTSANWNTAQTVSVNAVDNNFIDGTRNDTVTLTASSADTNYASTTASSVAVAVYDDDVGGVAAPTSVNVTEGVASNYTVALTAAPIADVTVRLSTSTQLSLSPASMIFTSANWNTAQTVTVTAVDNSIKDGARSATTTLTATSSDSNFNATSSNVTVTIVDDGDTASVITAASSTGATGTGTAGNMVTVTYLDGDGVTQTATTTVASDGTWSMAFVRAASNGSAMTIMDTDTAANVSTTVATSSKVVDATPPTLTADSENSTTKLVKGTGDAGETIVVSYTDKGGNAATATTTVAADGTWSITLDPAAKSNTAVTVTSTDANGNTATVTIASIASADIDAVEIQQDIEEVMAASGEMVIATVPSVGGFISAGSTAILSAPTSAGDTQANIKASDDSFAANLVTKGLRLSLNTTDSKTSAYIHTNDFKLGYDKGVGTLKASFTTQQMHVEIDETAAKTKLKFDGRLTPTRTKADRAGTINGWVSGELLRSEGSGNKMDLFVGRVGAHKFHDTDSLTGLMLTTDSGTGTFAADGFTTDNTVKIRSYMIGVYHGQKMQTAAGNSYNIEGQLHFGTSKTDLTTPAGDTGSTNGSRILATGRMSSDTTLGGYKLSPFIQGNYFNQKNDGFTTAQNNTVVAATKVSFADVALGTKFNYAQANGMTIGFEPSLVYRAKASGAGLNIDERTIRGRVSMDLDMPLQSAGGRLTTNVYLDGIGIASSRTYGASIKFERQF